MTHLQQVGPELIRSITEGDRCYVIIKNKRLYSEGDTLILEADTQLPVIITNVQTEPGIMKGYVVLSFRVVENEEGCEEELVHADPLIFEQKTNLRDPYPYLPL